MYQENLVPKGLNITLEPTIGNFDQDFIDNWHNNLKQFSTVLMKQIVAFYGKKEQKLQNSINETETILKQLLKREKCKGITDTIKPNETEIKQLLQQCKFKQFTSTKYKPKAVVKTLNVNNKAIRAEKRHTRSHEKNKLNNTRKD